MPLVFQIGGTGTTEWDPSKGPIPQGYSPTPSQSGQPPTDPNQPPSTNPNDPIFDQPWTENPWLQDLLNPPTSNAPPPVVQTGPFTGADEPTTGTPLVNTAFVAQSDLPGTPGFLDTQSAINGYNTEPPGSVAAGWPTTDGNPSPAVQDAYNNITSVSNWGDPNKTQTSSDPNSPDYYLNKDNRSNIFRASVTVPPNDQVTVVAPPQPSDTPIPGDVPVPPVPQETPQEPAVPLTLPLLVDSPDGTWTGPSGTQYDANGNPVLPEQKDMLPFNPSAMQPYDSSKFDRPGYPPSQNVIERQDAIQGTGFIGNLLTGNTQGLQNVGDQLAILWRNLTQSSDIPSVQNFDAVTALQNIAASPNWLPNPVQQALGNIPISTIAGDNGPVPVEPPGNVAEGWPIVPENFGIFTQPPGNPSQPRNYSVQIASTGEQGANLFDPQLLGSQLSDLSTGFGTSGLSTDEAQDVGDAINAQYGDEILKIVSTIPVNADNPMSVPEPQLAGNSAPVIPVTQEPLPPLNLPPGYDIGQPTAINPLATMDFLNPSLPQFAATPDTGPMVPLPPERPGNLAPDPRFQPNAPIGPDNSVAFPQTLAQRYIKSQTPLLGGDDPTLANDMLKWGISQKPGSWVTFPNNPFTGQPTPPIQVPPYGGTFTALDGSKYDMPDAPAQPYNPPTLFTAIPADQNAPTDLRPSADIPSQSTDQNDIAKTTQDPLPTPEAQAAQMQVQNVPLPQARPDTGQDLTTNNPMLQLDVNNPVAINTVDPSLGGKGQNSMTYGGTAAPLPLMDGYSPNMNGVDPRLLDIAALAATHLPDGYTVEISSARRGNDPYSQHYSGNAIDVHITDPNGNVITNRGVDTTGMYQMWAQAAYGEMLAKYPNLNGQLAWGGAFGTSAGSSVPDLMHLDLGGERGNLRPGNRLSVLGTLSTFSKRTTK